MRRLSLLILPLLCLPALPLQAGPLPTCAQPIKLALHDFGVLYSKQQERGIDKDLVSELARRSGCRFQITSMPRVRIWKMLKAGHLQMTSSGVLTAERAVYADVINVMALKNRLVLRRGVTQTSLGAFVDEPQLRLGVIRGFSYGAGYDELIRLLRGLGRVDESTDFAQLYDKLAAGRFQATLSQSVNYYPELQQRGLREQVQILDWMPHEGPMIGGLILSKRYFSAAEVEKWRALVEGMRADGSWRRILLGYLPEPEVEEMLRF
jgi:polar amino acid transport system substrate-binding protein